MNQHNILIKDISSCHSHLSSLPARCSATAISVEVKDFFGLHINRVGVVEQPSAARG
jgi:hypothetical protein